MDHDGITRVIVRGTRTFDDEKLLFERLTYYTSKLKKFILLTGAAKGADKLAEDWAFKNMVTYLRFHPDWEKHKKSAGVIRNRAMVEFAIEVQPAYCILFWDGYSPGTANMLQLCQEYEVKTKIVRYE